MALTPQDLANAEQDVETLGSFINGGPAVIVTNRAGASFPSLRKALADGSVTSFGAAMVDGSNLSDSDVVSFLTRLGLSDIKESLDDQIIGLTLAPNAVSGSVSIDIASGSCKDATSTQLIKLPGTLTKNLNGLWAYGNDLGGLDAGAMTVGTWYHIHLIKNPTNGAVDALFSTSPLNPALPAGFTLRRYLGSVLTHPDGSGIRPFIQIDDGTWFKDSVASVTGAPNGVPDYEFLTVPPGFKADADVYLESNGGEDKAGWLTFRDPDRGDYANVPEQANFFRPSQFFIQTVSVITDNLGRIYTGVTPINDPNLEIISIRTHGYTIDRSVYR